ncbi:MAG: pitrilysin family protein [Myxococcota bacterium]
MRARERSRRIVSVLLTGVGATLLGGCGGLLGPAPAWEEPAPAPVERPVVREGAVSVRELPNGLRVLIHEDHRLPRVVLGLTVRRGATGESPEDAGLASFTTELLERGAGDRDALAFAEVTDALGAGFGAAADWDTMGASISGLSRDFDTLVELLSDAVLRPRFDAREAERARSQLLAAFERAKDDPATLARWNLAKAIYGDHRFGMPTAGSPESVEGFDAKRARAFHAKLFVPNGAILSVSGDVDPDAAFAAVKEAFGAWERGSVIDPGAPPPSPSPAKRHIVVVDRPDLAQARINVGHDGIARTDDIRIPASLLNTVVGGGGFSSRLMSALRAENEAGLTYSASSGFSLRRAPGPFGAATFTRVEKVREALDILLAEIERGRTEPPAEDELGWARTLATGRFSMGLETADAVTGALVDLDVHGLPADSLDTYRARVRDVTPEDVAAAAKQLLHPERIAIVLVGPAEAIVPQVEDLAPVEVVQP